MNFQESLILTRSEGKARKERHAVTNKPTNKPFKLTPEHSATVLHTSDYAKFSYLPGNRAITPFHVQEIVISYENRPELVELRPILVNEKLQVIDGQHRLKALEVLHAPVPYIVTKGLSIQDAQLMNALQRPWTMLDFAHSYALANKSDYRILLDIYERYHIPLTVLVQYLAPAFGGKLHKAFKRGEFKISEDRKTVEEWVDKLTDFSDDAPTYFAQAPFAKAFLKIVRLEDYDHERMLKGFRAIAPTRQASQTAYLLQFERAYNFNKVKDLGRFV